MKMASILYSFKEDFLLFLMVISSLEGSLEKIPSQDNDINKDDIKKIAPVENQLIYVPSTKHSVEQRESQAYKRTQTARHQKQLILKQVEEYYKCINKSETRTRNIYKALVVKVGQTLVMKCHQCFQPGTPNEKRKEVKWKQFRQDGAIVSNIQPDNNYQLTPNRDLKIMEISLEDTGQFFCLRNNKYKAVYQVDVHRQLDYSIIEENSTVLLTKEPLPENNLELVSSWTSWTKCSQCGTKGIRTKTGICTIRKIFKDKPVKPLDIPAFYLFDGGVPCRSSVVPQRIAQLLPIAKRQSEILVSVCDLPCPTTSDEMIIKDQQGNIISVVQPGYYSIHDKPELAPTVKRAVIYKMEGKRAVLKCRTIERMVRWQNGTETLNFMTLRKKSKGRIFIDGNNWLHIKKITLADSAIYSCWKQDKLLSTIKLKVTKIHGTNVGPYITYTLAVILFVCVTWALYNIYRGPQNRVAY